MAQSLAGQLHQYYTEGDRHTFHDLGSGKDLSRILKTAEPSLFDFYGFTGESVAFKDHGDVILCGPMDYVINLTLFMVKGIIRALLIDSRDDVKKARLREIMWEIAYWDLDFSEESAQQFSMKQLVYLFEEKAVRNGVFRSNFQSFLQDHICKKYNKGQTLEGFIESLWKKNSLVDTAAFLVKIIVVDFGIPTNIYVSAGKQKTPILNYLDLFGVMPALVVIVESSNKKIGVMYGLTHSPTQRDLQVEDPWTGGNAPMMRSPTSMVSVTPSSGHIQSYQKASNTTLKDGDISGQQLSTSPIQSEKMSFDEDTGLLGKFMSYFTKQKDESNERSSRDQFQEQFSYVEPPKEIQLKAPTRAKTSDQANRPAELSPFGQESMLSKGSLSTGAYAEKVNGMNEQRRREPRGLPEPCNDYSYHDSSVNDSFLEKMFAFARQPVDNQNKEISFRNSMASSGGLNKNGNQTTRGIATAFDNPGYAGQENLDFNPFKASKAENERACQNHSSPANDNFGGSGQYEYKEDFSLSKRDRPSEAYAVNYMPAEQMYSLPGGISRPVMGIPQHTLPAEQQLRERDIQYREQGGFQLESPKGASYADRYFASVNAGSRAPRNQSNEVNNKWLDRHQMLGQTQLNIVPRTQDTRAEQFPKTGLQPEPTSYTGEYLKKRQANDVRSIWSYNQSHDSKQLLPGNSQHQQMQDYGQIKDEPNVFEGKNNSNVLDISLGSLFNVLNGNTDILAQQRVPHHELPSYQPQPMPTRPVPPVLPLHEADRPFAYNRDTMKESKTLRIYSNSPPGRPY